MLPTGETANTRVLFDRLRLRQSYRVTAHSKPHLAYSQDKTVHLFESTLSQRYKRPDYGYTPR